MPISRLLIRRTLAYTTGGTLLLAGAGYMYLNSGPIYPASTKETRRPPPPWTPPSRAEMIAKLQASDASNPGVISNSNRGNKAGSITTSPEDGDEFDLLIVGGGATGAGVAVDAASRGLKVALVERDDFSAGTSSKSTKLVHGGVRYLQKAVMELDYEQYKLVCEALHERKIFLETAPYLSSMLPIMLPIYKYWQVPYYYAGCKMYDILAGKENMEKSYIMTKGRALETFPMLKSEGLVGALVYYDGQHNDSRMNVALIMTAVKQGAVVANYCEVTDLHKDASGKLTGARVKDGLSGKEWNVKAKGVINATGPFSDALLKLDNPSHQAIVQPSSGIHITLPNYYSPRKMGLLDPATSDGRVIFFLPWQGNTIAGTTDTPANVEREPTATEDDIRWVLEEVRRYLSPDIKVRRGMFLGLVRNHMIHLSESGLLTIAGGKWTTYRAMAEETVDRAVEAFGLARKAGKCVTESLRLVGSDGWSRNMFIGLIQTYGMETEVAKHLSESYGDRAWTVCSLAEQTGESWPLHGKRLYPAYPFIEAEVRYAVRHEYAQTAIDVLARRTRLSFLNARAAFESLPRVVDIMSEELGWSYTERKKQIRDAVSFLKSMGLDPGYLAHIPEPEPRGYLEKAERALWRTGTGFLNIFGVGGVVSKEKVLGRSRFEAGELVALRAAFEKRASGADGNGKVRKDEVLEVLGDVPGYEGVLRKDYAYVLEEAGFGDRVDVDFDEFVEISGNLKEVSVVPSAPVTKQKRMRIPVEKSGGGV
ncbi:DAO-domain-containing protein [Cyathus striatus]|nr:DAO-domain-containing protein [Cyathus striatus]